MKPGYAVHLRKRKFSKGSRLFLILPLFIFLLSILTTKIFPSLKLAVQKFTQFDSGDNGKNSVLAVKQEDPEAFSAKGPFAPRMETLISDNVFRKGLRSLGSYKENNAQNKEPIYSIRFPRRPDTFVSSNWLDQPSNPESVILKLDDLDFPKSLKQEIKKEYNFGGRKEEQEEDPEVEEEDEGDSPDAMRDQTLDSFDNSFLSSFWGNESEKSDMEEGQRDVGRPLHPFSFEVTQFIPGRDKMGKPIPVKRSIAQINAILRSAPVWNTKAKTAPKFVSLGRRGSLTIKIVGGWVVDREGKEFATFNRVSSSSSVKRAFSLEPAQVSVSETGQKGTFISFPCDLGRRPPENCSGGRPFANRAGGVNLRTIGGDQFDLASIGVNKAKYIRIQDMGLSDVREEEFPAIAGADLRSIALFHAESSDQEK